MAEDKRRTKRLFQENEVTMTIISRGQTPLSECLIQLISADISASGARIQADRFLPVDSLLKLTVTLEASSQMVMALGRVRWVRTLFADEAYEAGLEFVNMSEDTTSQLAAYIATH